MRKIRHFLLLVLGLALLAWYAGPRIVRALRTPSAADILEERIQASRMSTIFRLSSEQWVVFDLPPGVEQVRIRTEAMLNDDVKSDRDLEFNYGISYSCDAADSSMQISRDHHFRTRLNLFKDETYEEVISPTFVLDPSVIPASGRNMLLNTKVLGSPRSIRIRLKGKDPKIEWVGVRVYMPTALSESELGQSWRRLSPTQKEGAARGNVFPYYLMPEVERRDLMRLRWKALGPRGVDGRDYESSHLYILRDFEGVPVDHPIIPSGLFIDRHLKGMIPIPEEGGKLTLQFEVPPTESALRMGSDIHLSWYGRGLHQRTKRSVAMAGTQHEETIVIGGGLVEITAPGDLVVNATLATATGTIDITPESRYLRTYRCEPDRQLVFDVFHAGDLATPVQLNFRVLLYSDESGSVPPQPTHACSIALLASDGNVHSTHDLEFIPINSEHDRPAGGPEGERVSEAYRTHFVLPKDIVQIRIQSAHQLLVSGAVRPSEIPHITKVPEDSYAFHRQSGRMPLWFGMFPANHMQTRYDGFSEPIVVQSRPPEDDLNILTGQYRWEEFHPVGDWVAREILGPREEGVPLRPEALSSAYAPISSGSAQHIQLLGIEEGVTVSPNLILLRDDDRAADIEVRIDEKTILRTEWLSTRSMFKLPPLRAGNYTLEIRSPEGTSAYLNHLPATEESAQKRLANRFRGEILQFTFERTTNQPETLSARFFAAHAELPRMKVRAEIMPPADRHLGPSAGWTQHQVDYDVRINTDAPSPILGTASASAYPAEPFFLHFNEDSPPGIYTIRFSVEGQRDAYLMLSRVIPGELSSPRWMNLPSTSQPMAELIESSFISDGIWKPIHADDLPKFISAFRSMLRETDMDVIAPLFSALGFIVEERVEEEQTLWVARESGPATKGRGVFVVRKEESLPVLLQIPHGAKDLHTRKIGIDLFRESRFTAGAWNTVPRWHDRETGRMHQDLAHEEHSVFNAFTRAFAAEFPDSATIQLHGYDQDKRESDVGKASDVILSSGTRQPGAIVSGIAQHLTKLNETQVAVFPVDVEELGGTTNDQGKLLRALDYHNFVHLEMSLPFRNKLLNQAEVRDAVRHAIEEATR